MWRELLDREASSTGGNLGHVKRIQATCAASAQAHTYADIHKEGILHLAEAGLKIHSL